MTDADYLAPYLRIYYAVEDSMDCIPEDEPRLDAAMTAYVDSCGTRDSVMVLTRIVGGDFTVKVSTVNSFFIQTAEQRREAIALAKAWTDFEKTVEAELGMF